MSRMAKVGVVMGGYAAAVLAGIVASWLYNARVGALPYDTSGGMYAAGEMMSSIAAFLVVALVPTLLALWFLRHHEGFWNTMSVASLAFAAVGLVAVLSPIVFPTPPRHVGSLVVELLRLAQLLGVPLWCLAFGLFAFLAPTRATRRVLVTATAIELVIGVCALVHWIVPRSPL